VSLLAIQCATLAKMVKSTSFTTAAQPIAASRCSYAPTGFVAFNGLAVSASLCRSALARDPVRSAGKNSESNSFTTAAIHQQKRAQKSPRQLSSTGAKALRSQFVSSRGKFLTGPAKKPYGMPSQFGNARDMNGT
jgi:hypothetical protein